VIDEISDLLAHSHSISNRWKKWKNFFCQLLNAHGVRNVRQTEVRTVEPLVPELSSSGVEVATITMKSYKSQCADKH
jgi:hypothetical protein